MAKSQKQNYKGTCVIYTRVSTAIQVDGYSLEAQKERLEKEAEHRGYEVLDYYPERGKSGKNIEGRPVFKKMLGGGCG
ncbi:MAG: recombinase family protein [Succinivibrionaceae bacterium]|nr:recombinase family protein [Succinivibrionaceae bacterium]